MASTKASTKSTQKSAKRSSANGETSKGFTDEEKAAMRERARELKAEAAKADGETELLAALAKMQEPDRTIAKKLHSPPRHRRNWPGEGALKVRSDLRAQLIHKRAGLRPASGKSASPRGHTSG